jgi:pimeloyl-ACP methyl ester carboxylesterase
MMINLEKNSGIYYQVSGEGTPVIFIHGVASSLYSWSNLASRLAEAGFRTYALDLPGHGESEKPEDPNLYHVEPFYSMVSAWIEGLNLPEPPLLVGHSLGGYLSLLYTIRHPASVRGMVLINPLYSEAQIAPLLKAVRQRPDLSAKALRIVPEWLIDRVLGWDPTTAANFAPEVRKQIANDYKRASPHFVYITREVPDLTEYLEEIKTDTLLIWGEQDLTLAPSSFHTLAQKLPNAAATPISNGGHQPHIGNPNLVTQHILEFVERLQWSNGADPYATSK